MDYKDPRTPSTFEHSIHSLSTLFYFLSPTLHFLFSFVFFFGVHNHTSLLLDMEWFDSFLSSLFFNTHLFLSLFPSLSLCLSIFSHILSSLVLILTSMKVWFSHLLESLFIYVFPLQFFIPFWRLKGRVLFWFLKRI